MKDETSNDEDNVVKRNGSDHVCFKLMAGDERDCNDKEN